MEKVIVDTDPAIGIFLRDVDDGLAIFFLLSHLEVSILGLTICYGNTSQRKAFNKAREVLRVAGREDLPVLKGANSNRDLGRESEASDFLIEQAKKYQGEITLLAIAPLTNVATAILRDKNFAHLLRRIIIMGGTIYKKGMLPPLIPAEFNFWRNPEAARIVLNAPVRKVLISMDLCQQTVITEKEYKVIKNRDDPISNYIANNIKLWLKINKLITRKGGFYPWDVVAVSYLIKPDIFLCKYFRLDIKTKGLGKGKTLVLDKQEDDRPRYIKVPVKIDSEKFKKLFMKQFSE